MAVFASRIRIFAERSHCSNVLWSLCKIVATFRSRYPVSLMNPEPCLQLQQIVKRFPGVVALDGVDFDVRAGEVHALVGENGAGKSTLIRIACGLYQPDAGEIILNGEARRFLRPHDARDAGIAVIHQEADLFPDLSVTENLLIGEGLPTHATGWIRWRDARFSARSALGEIGEELDEGRLGLTLTAAERQVVAIASALSQNVRVIIMDEPTASLAEREVHILFQSVERLREKGVAVIYITHRLEEVFKMADRVTVLRDGRKVWTRRVGDAPSEDGVTPANAGELVRAMVGREVRDLFPKLPAEIGEPAMRVDGLTEARGAFHEVSFAVRTGEILGLYGLIGAGRSEAAQGVFGLRETIGGSVEIAGKRHRFSSPREALAAGIAYLPEDRLVQGIFLDMNVRENSTIAVLRRLARAGYLSPAWEREPVQRLVDRIRVKGRLEDRADGLSGGNQQKVVLSRWLLSRPRVLILDEPTRGVDVGAKAEIHRLISELAGDGMAIVLISSELPEILGMSDRVVVFREGTVAGELSREEFSEEKVGALAFPQHEAQRRVGDQAELLEPGGRRKFWWWLVMLSRRREFGIGVFILLLFGVLASLDPAYLSFGNLLDTLTNISTLGIAGVGMTLIILAGGIDISVGSMLAVCATASGIAVMSGMPAEPALGAAVLAGGVAGAFNGGLAVFGRVHPIIVTLGTMSVFRGLVIAVTGGKWVTNLPAAFTHYGKGSWLGVPIPVVFLLLAVIAGQLFLSRYQWGRYMTAVGSNRRAATVVGIPVSKVTIASFVLGGLFTGLGSALYAARMGNIQTNSGQGFELEVIAATVIGGTNIMGGSGTVIGTFLGALLLELLDDTREFLHISEYYMRIAVGTLILLAVSIDVVLHRRYRRRKG